MVQFYCTGAKKTKNTTKKYWFEGLDSPLFAAYAWNFWGKEISCLYYLRPPYTSRSSECCNDSLEIANAVSKDPSSVRVVPIQHIKGSAHKSRTRERWNEAQERAMDRLMSKGPYTLESYSGWMAHNPAFNHGIALVYGSLHLVIRVFRT